MKQFILATCVFAGMASFLEPALGEPPKIYFEIHTQSPAFQDQVADFANSLRSVIDSIIADLWSDCRFEFESKLFPAVLPKGWDGLNPLQKGSVTLGRVKRRDSTWQIEILPGGIFGKEKGLTLHATVHGEYVRDSLVLLVEDKKRQFEARLLFTGNEFTGFFKYTEFPFVAFGKVTRPGKGGK